MSEVQKITNAEAALLGLLAEKPMYPYQLEQEVKYRDMRFWTELSMSSIYKLLRKLNGSGMVTKTTETSNENRIRTLYTLSEAGRSALIEKLEELLTDPQHVRWPVDIGTYYSDFLPNELIAESLRKYRRRLEEKKDGFERLLLFLRDAGCSEHRNGLATRHIALLKGEIEWLDNYLETVICKSK